MGGTDAVITADAVAVSHGAVTGTGMGVHSLLPLQPPRGRAQAVVTANTVVVAVAVVLAVAVVASLRARAFRAAK